MPIRVALATNFISPYRVPLFADLASTANWDFRLISCCQQEFDRQWNCVGMRGLQHKKSFSLSFKRTIEHRGVVAFADRREIHVPIGLWTDLWRFRPDVVISDEMGPRTMIAASYAKIAQKPLVVWFYGTPFTERDIDWKQRTIRKRLVGVTHAYIGMGSEARTYLKSLGIASDAIFDAPNATNWPTPTAKCTDEERLALRNKLGISGFCYLFVGRMNALKGITHLLEAWQRFSNDRKGSVSLLLTGDGTQRAHLIAQVEQRKLDGVRFLRFMERDELLEVYQAADAFVFPTLQDVWGLVVNEALTVGLPVICSKFAGCAVDMVADCKNGWIVDPTSAAQLVEALNKAFQARNKRAAHAIACSETAKRFTIANMAKGFRDAVEYSIRQASPAAHRPTHEMST